jgi:hypothetical protein
LMFKLSLVRLTTLAVVMLLNDLVDTLTLSASLVIL